MTRKPKVLVHIKKDKPDDPDLPYEVDVEQIQHDLRRFIRQEIAASGTSQRMIAEAMGMSQSTFSNMLTSRSYEPTPSEIFVIELLLGLQPGHFYARAGLVARQPIESLVWHDAEIHPRVADVIVELIRSARTQNERMRVAEAMRRRDDQEQQA